MMIPPAYDVISGSGCAGVLTAVLNGTVGLDPVAGLFSAGAPEQEAPPVKFSEKCLLAEKAMAGMSYTSIPDYCGADELHALVKTHPDCVNCFLALASIYSSTTAPPGTADAELGRKRSAPP